MTEKEKAPQGCQEPIILLREIWNYEKIVIKKNFKTKILIKRIETRNSIKTTDEEEETIEKNETITPFDPKISNHELDIGDKTAS